MVTSATPPPGPAFQVYLAGPLFSSAEREFLARCAERVRAVGLACFVPHEQKEEIVPLSATHVFAVNQAGIATSHAMLAWLDGAQVDDGTACEIGLFYGLMQARPERHFGIVGLVTDLRVARRKAAHAQSLNLFVEGLLERAGKLTTNLDQALAELCNLAGRDFIAIEGRER
jgi:nucleoside 2-deoxyribosyltransferase